MPQVYGVLPISKINDFSPFNMGKYEKMYNPGGIMPRKKYNPGGNSTPEEKITNYPPGGN